MPARNSQILFPLLPIALHGLSFFLRRVPAQVFFSPMSIFGATASTATCHGSRGSRPETSPVPDVSGTPPTSSQLLYHSSLMQLSSGSKRKIKSIRSKLPTLGRVSTRRDDDLRWHRWQHARSDLLHLSFVCWYGGGGCSENRRAIEV